MSTYQYDNAWQQARQRLAAFERLYDPGTIRQLQALGVDLGWRCLEVGGGGGSIAAWLAERVGPAGRVLATDLDTRFLQALDLPALEVRQHDIVADPLDEGGFDLVHARAVLAHLPQRQAVLRRLAGALRPGGWLLLEEVDTLTMVPDLPPDSPEAGLFLRHRDAVASALASVGADPYLGRRLFGLLAAEDLAEVGSEARAAMVQGGSPAAEVNRLSAQQLRPRVVGSGLLAEAEVEAFLDLLSRPDLRWMSLAMVAAWGRRPA